ncbi:hypothetical protein AMTR_s00013p00060560 [Amborella trichopoda]|uniref:NFD4 C-terminal domain-containing protein n=1 Tax=Amborella trichopoda TaxID=13333 RepID=W1PPW4_AMBTC|nr:hypothetical protein AMTR_s00013p00060560 [Amborella trichopoda]
MAIGHFLLAMAWPGVMYVGTLLIGLGYGTHWAVVPATASELFGLKNFGTLYNFITLANPAGALVFSGVIASTIYDYEAQKQAQGLCIFAAVLSMIAMHRTKVLYANLYGKSLS